MSDQRCRVLLRRPRWILESLDTFREERVRLAELTNGVLLAGQRDGELETHREQEREPDSREQAGRRDRQRVGYPADEHEQQRSAKQQQGHRHPAKCVAKREKSSASQEEDRDEESESAEGDQDGLDSDVAHGSTLSRVFQADQFSHWLCRTTRRPLGR